MKVFCLKPNEGWIIDRIADEFCANSRHACSYDSVIDADVVWLLGSWCWKRIDPRILSKKSVICTVHHTVPEKFNVAEFVARDQFVTEYHVPCKQTADNIRPYTKKPINVVGYWVDTDFWDGTYVVKSISRSHYGIKNDEIAIGSFQRDSEGTNTSLPKLEKGPDVFCDFVTALRDAGAKVRVMLNAWRRQYVMGRLDSVDIPYEYVEMPDMKRVREMYGVLDLYVVGSRYEGGPQAILECAAMRVPVLSTDCGMARDVLDESCVFDAQSLGDVAMNNPLSIAQAGVDHAYARALDLDMRRHISVYDAMLERVANAAA